MPTELYKLSFAREERRYEGFALSDTPSILGGENLIEDITPRTRMSGKPAWVPPRFNGIWIPPKVTGGVSPKHDSPGINLIYPAFSKRACDSLTEFLACSGELLPLNTNVGEYYFFNITKIIDAIDHSKSVCTYSKSDPLRVVDIHEYAFHESMLEDASIFRTVDLPINVVVSKRFLERVLSSNLRGFRFTKLWPHPPGTKWRQSDEILT